MPPMAKKLGSNAQSMPSLPMRTKPPAPKARLPRVSSTTSNVTIATIGSALPKHMINYDKQLSVMTDTPSLSLVQGRQEAKHGVNNTFTMITVFKAMVGAGILSLPVAFYNCGLWVGVVLVPFFLAINIHGMHILISYAHYFCVAFVLFPITVLYLHLQSHVPEVQWDLDDQILEKNTLDYADVAEMSFKYGPRILHSKAVYFRRAVNGSIFAAQLGFCCTYVIFVASNIKQVIDYYKPGDPLSLHVYMLIIAPAFLLICYIRHLKHLSFTSFIANGMFIVGLLIIIQYVVQGTIPVSKFPAFNSAKSFGLSLGTIMFTFECVSLILSIENRMKDPTAIVGWNGVLNTVAGWICALYVAIGFFGYLKFGPAVADTGTITLNLPPSEPLYQATKLLFALAIFLTYPLQMLVCFDVIHGYLDQRYPNEKKKSLLYGYIARTLLVCLTALAEAIPHIDLFVSLVGAVTCTTLALIFPATIDLAMLATEMIAVPHNQIRWYRNWRAYKDIVLVVIGTVVGVAGTYSSINAIVLSFM